MFKTIVILFALLLSSNSFAGIDEAKAAYDAGDYKTVLQEYKVLTELGSSSAQSGLGIMYIPAP